MKARPSSLALPRLALPILVTLGCLGLSATAAPQGVVVRGSESSGAVLADGPVDGGGPLELVMPGDSLLGPAAPATDAAALNDPTLAATAPGDVVAGSGGTSGAVTAVPAVSVSGSASGIPGKVLAAYQAAAASIAGDAPGCHLPWQVLAGIGKVESGHARGGALDENGRTISAILGPELNGSPGVAAIADTDNGRWDGDTTWDRAVGPMQFIPGSWRVHGADGNRDGVEDPSNMFDAAAAAAGYLCTGGRDLSNTDDLRRAVFGYNHSLDYVATVLAWARVYTDGGVIVTAASTSAPVSTPSSSAAPGGGRDPEPPVKRKPSRPSGTPTPGSTPTPGAPGGTSTGTTTPGAPAPGTPAPGTPTGSTPGTPTGSTPGTPTDSTPGTTPTLPPPTSLPPTDPADHRRDGRSLLPASSEEAERFLSGKPSPRAPNPRFEDLVPERRHPDERCAAGHSGGSSVRARGPVPAAEPCRWAGSRSPAGRPAR